MVIESVVAYCSPQTEHSLLSCCVFFHVDQCQHDSLVLELGSVSIGQYLLYNQQSEIMRRCKPLASLFNSQTDI